MELSARGLSFRTTLSGPDSGEPVLLLHGFPQHSGQWDAVAPALHAAGLRTVAVDQRGYSPGARPADVGAYRILECAYDVVSIMDALGLPSAHLVGHDFGAICAWQVALRHPARVRTLTAISAPHPLALAQALADDADRQRERFSYLTLFRREGHAEEVLLADGARRLRHLFDGSGMSDAQVDRYVVAMLAPGALTGALNWYRAASDRDLVGLGKAGHPTTYLWGADDPAIGRGAAHACAEYVAADYRYVELSGTGHWLTEQAPGQVAAAILARIHD